jgi:hypothetical protein
MIEKVCAVYWLHDGSCISPERHGYIGVTGNLSARLKQHRTDKRKGKGAIAVPGEFSCQILFSGPFSECLALEKRLRPDQGIGWNLIRGGQQGWLGWQPTKDQRKRLSESKKGQGKGRKHKPESIAKMKAAALRRYADPNEPRPIADYWRGKDRSGPNNPRFGMPVSEKTRAKIGKANRRKPLK